jgi:putative flippase GtrA
MMVSKYSISDYRKIFRFLLIGGFTFVMYYSILWICFSFASLPYVGAVAIAYSASIIFHFLANRRVTFNADGVELWRQLPRYIALALLNYVIQLGVIRVCYGMYGIDFYISAFLGVMLTMITGYLLMNSWVFKGAEL